jgi:hypothetical protein
VVLEVVHVPVDVALALDLLNLGMADGLVRHMLEVLVVVRCGLASRVELVGITRIVALVKKALVAEQDWE